MLAEAAALIGAALRRSPVVAASEPNAFQLPRIRDWQAVGSEAATTGERRNAAPIKPADSAIITIPICWALKRSRDDSSKRLSATGSPFFFASKRIKALNGCGFAPWQAMP